MRKEINLMLEEGEEKAFPFRSCGTTTILYRSLFGADLMQDISALLGSVGESGLSLLSGDIEKIQDSPEAMKAVMNILGSGRIDVVYRMAFIMNRHAEGFKIQELTLDNYYDWLEQFEALELLYNAGNIISIYMGSRATTTEVKKNRVGRQKGN